MDRDGPSPFDTPNQRPARRVKRDVTASERIDMIEHATRTADGMTRRTWLATGSAMLATACAAGRAPGLQSSSSLHPPSSILDNDLPRWMRLASVPGVSLAIVGRDR